MKTEQWNFFDKTQWPWRGPWDNEPDKVQWPDPETGLPCLAKRNGHLGFWCGYVGVDETHPLYGHGNIYEDLSALEVHGGVTFAGGCQKREGNQGICHIPDEGEPDHVFWIGFDCGHDGDFSPPTSERLGEIMAEFRHLHEKENYRDLEYVKGQCRDLARQLHEMKS